MTINEALSMAAELTGESADMAKLRCWLAELESTICSEIVATHEGAPAVAPILADTDGNRVLFVPDPDSELYILYLVMKNDFYLRDTDQYAASASAFGTAYASFADKYNREHMPVGEDRICI